MKRLALNDLVEWNNQLDRKPLIVWGARQVGKTYLIKDLFADEYYKDNYVYIDCSKEEEFKELCNNTVNADTIIRNISVHYHKEITKDTLIIFDEIQEYPNIITSLKYFCQDHREIPVIATGSMVRIQLVRETKKKTATKSQFLFPVGKINQITIKPMNFEEYLMNANDMLYEIVKKAYENKEPLDGAMHQLAMDYFYKYMLIGGMPEVVEKYLKTNDILASLKILKEIYDNYLSDMQLYQASTESIVRSRMIFNNIYSQLNKESKNFSSGMIEKGKKTRDFRSPLEWLVLSHLINESKQVKERVAVPLTEENENYFRLYLSDVGIFSYQSGINASTFLYKDAENKLAGIFFENYVACELVAQNIDLFYWRGKNRHELEFITQSNGELFVIDAKKSKGSLNSLDDFSNHNKFELAIKVSANNYGYNKQRKLLTIPYYFMSFLAKDLANGTINRDLLNEK